MNAERRPGTPDWSGFAGIPAREQEQVRLATKVARLYHERGMRQPEIASRLHLSQARVSRLLRSAQEMGIVRLTVVAPPGLYGSLEDELEERYGLLDVHVADVVDTGDEDAFASELGRFAADYLHASLFDLGVVGFLSWSRPVMAFARWLQPTHRPAATYVVEMLGSLQDPAAQLSVSRATQRFAQLTSAEPVFLSTPGVASSPAVRDALVAQDHYARRALEMHDLVDTAIIGVGTVPLSELLQRSWHLLSAEDVQLLHERGAAGNINLCFFDLEGCPVASSLDGRVIGMSLDQLSRVRRSIAVAGGPLKIEAIRGALMGCWIDVLVTDVATAEALRDRAPVRPPDWERRRPRRVVP